MEGIQASEESLQWGYNYMHKGFHIAQLVEHEPLNLRVLGASPTLAKKVSCIGGGDLPSLFQLEEAMKSERLCQ